MGKNWQRIPQPNAVTQTFGGVSGKEKCRENNLNKKLKVRELR